MEFQTIRKPRQSIRQEIRNKVLEARNYCSYCGTSSVSIEIDHILPFYLGGTNELSNLTTCCSKCNSTKHTYSIDQFLYSLLKKTTKEREWVSKTVVKIRLIKKGIITRWDSSLDYYYGRIERLRKRHSFFYKIIHSIVTEKYKLFN